MVLRSSDKGRRRRNRNRAGTSSFPTQVHAFFKASVAKGEECFGNLADNLTAIVVYLHPPGVGTTLGAAPPPAPAPAPAPAAPAIEEAQEDWGA